MQQILSIWTALSWGRRIFVIGATLAMFGAVLLAGNLATTPGMALLYSGLEPRASGEVVSALESRGIRHEVRGNAIYVPEAERDQLRMTLATEGLPANGGTGYELLDSMTGFGTTSQMFDAAYWRAKEGELARTIASNPRIKSARVHIANVQSQPFRRDVTPTASVTVATSDGSLPMEQARAFRFLVASAVPGMQAESVTVIDQRGVVLTGEDAANSSSGRTADRADELRKNVLRLVEARVGPGRAVVEVSLDTNNDRESIIEKVVDPASRVAISLDSEERSANSSDSPAPAAGVASNLPEGEAQGEGGSSRSQNSETRERTNFEVSQTQREIQRGPGDIRRLTVAVMVDGVRTPGANGESAWQPLPEEELTALRDLVSSAVGFNAERGDVITMKSMPFERPLELGTSAESSLMPPLESLMPLAKLATLGAVALAIGLFVVRPILTARTPVEEPRIALPEPVSPVLTGEIDDGSMPSDLQIVSPQALAAQEDQDPVARLRKLISDRQNETVEILRGWMEEPKEKA